MIVAIDTDPGIDDALALLLAWSSPGVEVSAITTVAGNVPVDVATVNLLRLLELRGPSERPVIGRGAAEPLARPLRTGQGYHGDDGLGDVPDWPAVDLAGVIDDGVTLLLDTARRHGRRLTLVALGPLTNVAHALRRDRASFNQLGRVVVMGGAVDVPGNVTPTAEFNVWVDPEAAAEVFECGREIDVVALDATRQVVLTRAELASALAKLPERSAARIAAFTECGFRVDAARGTAGMVLHDPLAVGLAIDPTLARWERARLTVTTDAGTRRVAGAPNCRIAREIDRDRFVARFLAALGTP